MSTPSPAVSIRPPRSDEQVVKQENPLLPILEKQRSAFLQNGIPSVEERVRALETLGKAVGEYSDKLVAAVQADFGHRSPHETYATEVLGVLAEIKFTKGKIKKWAKPKKPAFGGLPGGRIVYQPKGVIGIMGAWNYPVMLTLSPLIGVLASGNHAMLKPSDMTPRTAEIMEELISRNFSDDYVKVITGDVQVAVDFSTLPYDHLMYTGNTEIGRRVMMAAAKNLTPVTLELGGKSPTIIADNFPVKEAIARVMMGKSMNAGQTCIAPDYVLINKNRVNELVDAFEAAATKRYPSVADNQDITWIVNDRHFQRVTSMIEDAREKGATVTQVNPRNETIPAGSRVIPLTIITNTTDDMRVMQEEIFGPVLPVKGVENLDEAFSFVKSRPRPLALYYFDSDKKQGEQVMNETLAGGACVNDTVVHLANMNMPFGGTGDSGIGAYHGFDGFCEFSHKKAVQISSARFSPTALLGGPYPQAVLGVMKKASKWLS
ncbi:MAG: coniferyl aldehyde dehydrogenase [Gammaproteobacteria bacterium]|nr:coniferyl aldehyde dehydrogenase [Gammaproteobacteria bacterium]